MKNIVVLGFCIALSFGAKASELILRDSIGIEKIGDKSFIIHQVEERETLFGISRRYQVAVNEIIQNNAQLQEGLKLGQRIKVPFIAKAVLPEGAKLHKVEPGETLFAISKRYNVTVSDVLKWNNLQGTDLSVGQSLIIEGVAEKAAAPQKAAPTTPSSTTPVPSSSEKPVVSKSGNETISKPAEKAVEEKPVASRNPERIGANLPGDWITHTVGQGETLFAISKKYDANMEDIITWNALSSNNISVGQKLKVGREANSNVPVVTSSVPVIINNERTNATLSSRASDEDDNTAYKNIKQTGLAELIEGTGNHKKYLVLHRDAPVGTIMRVRNEENDITIFARVVGKLPETGDNTRLIIKLSKAAFEQLRAVNARFPVEISY
ncbi:LysM peptidoglycan-binding domain-containing protein [Aquiflexum sp.]|uniref:LysM peptidoglycan-binding domain-containing protein n=1 Tax=Aquiflexum sp. TaxID=1872584 RepID=UPI0035947B5F